MKQILILSILLTGILIAKNKTMPIPEDSQPNKVKISSIQNGIVKQHRVYTVNEAKIQSLGKHPGTDSITQYTFANGNKFHSKSKIMIKFKSSSHIDMKAFERKYHLKLIRKMNSGDYLFKNMDGDTLNIINTILADNSVQIERIMPNLILNVMPL